MTSPTAPQLQLAIIGAGIAGLTAAIALKNHPGIDIQIYDRASALREVGASIGIGPNGMRTIDRLGLDNVLDSSIAFQNKSGKPMIYRHYKTNELISVDEPPPGVLPKHRIARFYRVHLQQALLEHVDPARIHLSKAFQSVTSHGPEEKLVITFADGTATTADLVLGADGIKSAVRQFHVPSSTVNWTGWVTYRSVFPISHVAHIPDLPDEATHIWGPGRTFFVSKLGKDLFCVIGSDQSDPDEVDNPLASVTWDSVSSVDVLRRYYEDWSPLVRAIIDATPHTRAFPNTAAQGLDSWVLGDDGRVTLAGDAAHAHGGAHTAGGSLALDDAWAFAAALQHVFPATAAGQTLPTAAQIKQAISLYERTRKPHTDRVLQTVHAGNKHKIELAHKKETDEELRYRMTHRYDPAWIHTHDVVAAFTAAVGESADV